MSVDADGKIKMDIDDDDDLSDDVDDIISGDNNDIIDYGEPDFDNMDVGVNAKVEQESGFDVEFINESDEVVNLYWDDGSDGVFMSEMKPKQRLPMNTFNDHRFYWTPTENSYEKLDINVMTPAIGTYILKDKETRARIKAEYEQEKREFMDAYYQRNGIRWGNVYPRDPVTHFMHNITNIGQKITVKSNYTRYNKCDINEYSNKDDIKTVESDGYYYDKMNELKWRYYNNTYYCRNNKEIEIELEVLCTKPKVMRILNFLSDDECESIINLGIKHGLERSTVGQGKNIEKTVDRTSQTVWLERKDSELVNNIIRRISNVTRIDERLLYLNESSEELQLVHYFSGELYKSHVDWERGSNNRYVTFLMYLNDVKNGGETSFPIADKSCKNDKGWFGAKPIKGSALMFYNLFKDGNVDQLAQHFAQPPNDDSEKWMTNTWIWDKKFVRTSK